MLYAGYVPTTHEGLVATLDAAAPLRVKIFRLIRNLIESDRGFNDFVRYREIGLNILD